MNMCLSQSQVNRLSERMTARRYLQCLLISCLIFLTVFFFTSLTITRPSSRWSSDDQLFCHGISNEDSLPDISDHPPSPLKRNIFFLETTCNSFKHGKIYIEARQACAVESAARMNPDMDVHLLFASPGTLRDEGTQSDRFLRALTAHSNVKLLHFDLKRFVQESPVEVLWSTGRIKQSQYPVAHVSDILRSGKGHQYMEECLQDVAVNFNGKSWGGNGPHLITRNIFKHCANFDPPMLIRFGICDQFRVIPPSGFYMVPYKSWQWLFNEDLANEIVSYMETNSYMVHVWNKLSFNHNISKADLNVPYLRLASKYCPGVVQELDKYF